MRTRQLFVWMIVYLMAAVLLASGAEYGDRLAVAIQQHRQRAIDERVEELKRALEEAEGEAWITRYALALEAPILPPSGQP